MNKEYANPNLPFLNPRTKQKLIDIADKYAMGHKDNVLTYLQRNEITIDEMPLLEKVPEVKSWLQKQYDEWLHQPDAKEQEDWKKIEELWQEYQHDAANAEISSSLQASLERYIRDYEVSLPEGNHVAEAGEYVGRLSMDREAAEWQKVDVLDYSSLINYYRAHKNTPYFKELDKNLWDIVSGTLDDLDRIRRFMRDLPNSSYYEDAKKIEKGFSDWETAKVGSVHDLKKYIDDNPNGAFVEEAKRLLPERKCEYLVAFKEKMASKTIGDYQSEINSGIFTASDFVDAGIVTSKSLKRLIEVEAGIYKEQRNVEYTNYENSKISCPLNHTDVYLFGVPSTGKTCVLMGLLNSNLFNWNAVEFGGVDAGEQLQYLCDKGILPARTIDSIVIINGKIRNSSGDVVHPINIIDMSGEDFAFKISKNPDTSVSFADMGSGVPELLQNENDKVFFFFIDPTKNCVIIKRIVAGDLVDIEVDQKAILNKFMSLLEKNEDIMKRVKAIHFIATKADCLSDDRASRLEKALKKIVGEDGKSGRYNQPIEKLKGLCDRRDCNINVSSDNRLLLLDYSLGKFYMGGIFEYDSHDSDKIINFISEISAGKREFKTKWERLVDWFNE